MPVTSHCKSEAEFPEPHKFGVWWNRNGFQVYRNLSMVKAAITNNTKGGVIRSSNIRIYEHTGESWELIYELNQGDVKADHELWAKGPAPKTLAVSESAVDAAIASIMGTTQS